MPGNEIQDNLPPIEPESLSQMDERLSLIHSAAELEGDEMYQYARRLSEVISNEVSVTGQNEDVLRANTLAQHFATWQADGMEFGEAFQRVEKLSFSLGQISLEPTVEYLEGENSRLYSEAIQANVNTKQAVAAQLEAEEKAKSADFDKLTGLASRAKFEDELETAVKEVDRYRGTEAALLFIDLDGFKPLNDEYGHLFGDEVLKLFAELMEQVLQRKTDVAARFGGDEFAMLLHGSNLEKALGVAHDLLAKVQHLRYIHGKKVKLGASIGVTSVKRNETMKDIIQRVDKAMYAAKQNKGTDKPTIAVGDGDVVENPPPHDVGSAFASRPMRIEDIRRRRS